MCRCADGARRFGISDQGETDDGKGQTPDKPAALGSPGEHHQHAIQNCRIKQIRSQIQHKDRQCQNEAGRCHQRVVTNNAGVAAGPSLRFRQDRIIRSTPFFSRNKPNGDDCQGYKRAVQHRTFSQQFEAGCRRVGPGTNEIARIDQADQGQSQPPRSLSAAHLQIKRHQCQIDN